MIKLGNLSSFSIRANMINVSQLCFYSSPLSPSVTVFRIISTCAKATAETPVQKLLRVLQVNQHISFSLRLHNFFEVSNIKKYIGLI